MEESDGKRMTSLEDFKTLRIIGKGNYAKVVLVRKCDNNRIYALKVIKKTKILERNQKEHVFSEKQILVRQQLTQAKCDHPFIVKMASTFHNDKKLFFVLEYCPGGELFNLIRKKGRFSQEMARFYAAQMVLGLEYLHFNGIVYIDLKPENVLLDGQGYIRLSDFGLSVQNYTQKDKFFIAGSPQYLAPQVLMKTEVGPEVDWWCLGTIIYEMVTGFPPFYEEEQPKEVLLHRIKTEQPKWKFMVGKELKDLLMRLLDKNRQKRLGHLGAQTVKDHPWFKGVKWEVLLRRQVKAPFVPVLKNQEDVSCFDGEFTVQALSPPELVRNASVGSDPTYKGFTYERSSHSKSGSGGSAGSPGEVSIPSASPPEDSSSPEFKLRTKEGDEL